MSWSTPTSRSTKCKQLVRANMLALGPLLKRSGLALACEEGKDGAEPLLTWSFECLDTGGEPVARNPRVGLRCTANRSTLAGWRKRDQTGSNSG
jgi:hypothetical protein